MPSHYYTDTKRYVGNCAPNSIPPPGMSYTELTPEEGMLNPVWDGSKYVGEDIPTPDIIGPPDWDSFVTEIMSNELFKSAWIRTSVVDPTIGWSLPTAFSQVGQGYTNNFRNIFEAICLISNITIDTRQGWALIAENHNIPEDFIQIVLGNKVQEDIEI